MNKLADHMHTHMHTYLSQLVVTHLARANTNRGGTYLTEINFLKFFRQFHMVIYVG